MNSIKFNDIDTYEDWGLLLKPRTIPKPAPKTNYVDIPGGDGTLDLSEVVSGEIKYKDLTLTFEFHVVDDMSEWDSKVSEITNYLHGRNMKIVQSADPDYYYFGRCTVDKFSSSKALGTIAIKCVVKPYKLKHNITINSYEIDTEGKATGEEITLTDSNNMPFNKFIMRGKSEQETRSGKNLLNNTLVNEIKTGITLTVNEDKSVTLSGTATEDTPFYFMTQNNPMLLKAGTYILSGNSSNSSNIRLLLYTKDWQQLGTNLSDGTTVIIEEDTEVFAYIWIASGTTVNLTMYPMIELGDTKTEYEPYGASPSPDYPSEIKNVEGNIEVKVEGKNKLPNIPDKTITFLGVTAKVVNNEITVTGTATDSGGRLNALLYFKLPAGSYKFGLTTHVQSNVFLSNKNTLAVIKGSLGDYQTFILAEETEIVLGINANKDVTYDEKFKIMIIPSDVTDYNYEPYKSQTAYFPLAEGQKLMEGSYLADDGVHNIRKQVVFDGSDDENWTANGTSQGYGIVIDNIGGNNNGTIASDVLCNKLTCVPQNKVFNGSAINGVASLGSTVNKIYVRFDSSITTVTLLRSKLAENPITVEYELAEEEIVPYTEEQQEAWNNIKKLTSYKNITHIYSTNEVSPYFDITYQKTAEKIEIKNDRMSVIPKITCEEDFIITFKDNSYNLSAGTHEILDIQFKEGINIVELSGTGTVKFEFQEGSL